MSLIWWDSFCQFDSIMFLKARTKYYEHYALISKKVQFGEDKINGIFMEKIWMQKQEKF